MTHAKKTKTVAILGSGVETEALASYFNMFEAHNTTASKSQCNATVLQTSSTSQPYMRLTRIAHRYSHSSTGKRHAGQGNSIVCCADPGKRAKSRANPSVHKKRLNSSFGNPSVRYPKEPSRRRSAAHPSLRKANQQTKSPPVSVQPIRKTPCQCVTILITFAQFRRFRFVVPLVI